MGTHLDDILSNLKLSGRYYLKCLSLFAFSAMCCIPQANNYVFAALETRYRCVDERFGNDSCANLNNSTEVCTEWVYEDPNSLVAEFQLACQEWKRTLIGTMNGFGYMVGLILVGPLSDRIGRKKAIITCGVMSAICGTIKSFTTNYWMYIVLEFLGTAIGNYDSPAFTMSIEIIDHERRLITQMIIEFGYAAGFLLLPLVAWLVNYWRRVLLIIYLLPLSFVSLVFLLEENPRWLLIKGQKDKAIAVLEKIAKTDKLDLNKIDLQNLTQEEVKRESYLQLLKNTMTSKILLKRFLICVTWWIAGVFINYGMQINSVSLQGNKYVNFSFLSITEVLGNIVMTFFVIRYSRRSPLAISFFLAAVLCLCQSFTPKNMSWLSITLYMSGKFMSVIFFNITYVYTSELFPTYTRNSMHALCSAIGRIGSILAPQTPLLRVYWEGLPSVTFSAVSFIAGVTTLFAPKTSDDVLPDTVRQAEAIGNQNSEPSTDGSQKRRSRKEKEPENHEHRF